MSQLWMDAKHALRAVRRKPGLSLAIALTLALGLGLNAMVLGMVDALLLRPFQFPEHDRIVIIQETSRGSGARETAAPASFAAWRHQTTALDTFAAWQWWDATLTGRDQPQRVAGHRVSSAFFDLFGVRMTAGRAFGADAEVPGADRQVVISDALWRRTFGSDPHIVGQTVPLNGETYTVVGIAPPRFTFPVGAEVWVPLAFTPGQELDRTNRMLVTGARLRTGVTVATAQAELDTISHRLALEYPDSHRDRGASVALVNDAFREPGSGAIVAVLQLGALLVLLIACANIAGLLLARGVDRQRDFALRTALGASRARIVRLFVGETVLLCIAACLLGTVFAAGALEVMRTSMPPDMARFIEGWDNIRLNGRLLLAMPTLALVLGVLVGLGPAWRATRGRLADALKQGEHGATGGRSRQRTGRVLVAAEIAFALALLVTAGLTIAGGVQLANRPGGFDADRLVNLEIQLANTHYPEPESIRTFVRDLQSQITAVGGVESTAAANILPAGGWSPASRFVVDGRDETDAALRPSTGYRIVTPDFFETLRIPVRGRTLSEFDRSTTEPVVVISEALARQHFLATDPIGRRVRLERFGDTWFTIVGVAGDVSMYNWWDGAEDFGAVYASSEQVAPERGVHLAVRMRGESLAAASALRAAVRAVDPGLPVRVRTMRQAIADNSLGLTYVASLMGLCGGVALSLAAVGIAGVMAYDIAQRRREFALRTALGATRSDIFRLLLKQAGIVTAFGLAAGLGVALLLSQAIASALTGLITLHPVAFIGATVFLAGVALLAAVLPARRAVSGDFLQVLRSS